MISDIRYGLRIAKVRAHWNEGTDPCLVVTLVNDQTGELAQESTFWLATLLPEAGEIIPAHDLQSCALVASKVSLLAAWAGCTVLELGKEENAVKLIGLRVMMIRTPIGHAVLLDPSPAAQADQAA